MVGYGNFRTTGREKFDGANSFPAQSPGGRSMRASSSNVLPGTVYKTSYLREYRFVYGKFLFLTFRSRSFL